MDAPEISHPRCAAERQLGLKAREALLDLINLGQVKITRRKFKCAGCGHQFGVTSGTIIASRKMAFVDLLAAM
tara:strand:+ start:1660 stop:1878 length:219 start_codon:yes stop_codon:yes gene_type:complete